MTDTCTPTPYETQATPYQPKTSPFSPKASVFTPKEVYSPKTSPFGQGMYCPILLQETGAPLLQETRSNIEL